MLRWPTFRTASIQQFFKTFPCVKVCQEEERDLPLLNLSLQVSKGDILNLNNSDLIACTVTTEVDVVCYSVYNKPHTTYYYIHYTIHNLEYTLYIIQASVGVLEYYIVYSIQYIHT